MRNSLQCKLILSELTPPPTIPKTPPKARIRTVGPPTEHVAKASPQPNTSRKPSSQETGCALWPLLTTENDTKALCVGARGFIRINLLLQTTQLATLNITKLDILPLCLCEANKEFNEHYNLELDQTHQCIRHVNKSHFACN